MLEATTRSPKHKHKESNIILEIEESVMKNEDNLFNLFENEPIIKNI